MDHYDNDDNDDNKYNYGLINISSIGHHVRSSLKRHKPN